MLSLLLFFPCVLHIKVESMFFLMDILVAFTEPFEQQFDGRAVRIVNRVLLQAECLGVDCVWKTLSHVRLCGSQNSCV